MNVEYIVERIRNWCDCDNCPLKKRNIPLVFIPQRRVETMVITEGPNRVEEPNFITSLANHPTYTFLYTLFSGNFVPDGEKATAYWTHVRKCFIKSRKGEPVVKGENLKNVEKKALNICSKAYLKSEIECINPKLILAVGEQAKDFFVKNGDDRLRGRLEAVFEKQIRNKSIFRDLRISKEVTVELAVVPHPSGLNRFWNKPIGGTQNILEMIRKEITRTVE